MSRGPKNISGLVEMADTTWSTVEVPILEAIASLESMNGTDAEAIASHVGIDLDVCLKALVSLIEAGYAIGRIDKFLGGTVKVRFVRLLERGKVQVGQWPSDEDIYENLLELLDRQMAAADKAEQKRIGAVKDAVIKAGPNLIITLGKAWLEHILGGRP